MVRRIGGSRRRSKHIFQKHRSERGKLSLTKYFQSFKIGERVQLNAEPAVQKGMYHSRFHGKSGIIQARTGKCYEVLIQDGGKKKSLLVYPVHLKRG